MKAFEEWWQSGGCTVEELYGAEKGWRAALEWILDVGYCQDHLTNKARIEDELNESI